MTATIHYLCDAPKSIGKLANSITRRSGLAALAKAEERMFSALKACAHLEALIEEWTAEGNQWLVSGAQDEFAAEIKNAAASMREVMLFRLQLGMQPHPVQTAFEIARSGK